MNENSIENPKEVIEDVDKAQEKITHKRNLNEVITNAVEAVGYDENDVDTYTRMGFLPTVDSIRDGAVSKTVDRYGNEGTLIKLTSVSVRGEQAETIIVSQGKGKSSVYETQGDHTKEYILEPNGQVSISSGKGTREDLDKHLEDQFTEIKPLVSTYKK